MKNVLLVGQFTDISGYGNAVRSYFTNLKNLHDKQLINLSIINYSFEKNSTISDELLHLIQEFSVTKSINTLQGNYDKADLKRISNYIENEFVFLMFLTNDFLLQGDSSSEYMKTNHGTLNFQKIVDKSTATVPCVVWETDKPPRVDRDWETSETQTRFLCNCLFF